jgi:hypothetical protein
MADVDGPNRFQVSRWGQVDGIGLTLYVSSVNLCSFGRGETGKLGRTSPRTAIGSEAEG